MDYGKTINQLIKLYFYQPKILYEHLFSSYHQLIEEIIPYYLTNELNVFYSNISGNMSYTHGFKCSNIKIKPPVDDRDNKILFPRDARNNHRNYFAAVVADIEQVLEIVDMSTDKKEIKQIGKIEKDYVIANIPVMVKSKYCSTQIKHDESYECKYHPGGYFIINGMEKIVVSIEKVVENKTIIIKKSEPTFAHGKYGYTAQIYSKKNDWADNLQIISIKNKKEGQLYITLPQLIDIPIFVLFRALNLVSDREIIANITYNLDDVEMINLLRESANRSIDDNGNRIYTHSDACDYLANKIRKLRHMSDDPVNEEKQKKMMLYKILHQDMLPHLGTDVTKKIRYIGYMINKLLSVWLGREQPDDRDSLHNKRIETPGVLIGQLFKQNWKKILIEVGKTYKKKKLKTDDDKNKEPIEKIEESEKNDEIDKNSKESEKKSYNKVANIEATNMIGNIKGAIIEQGIKTALATGVWGLMKQKKGVAQAYQMICANKWQTLLRQVITPSMDQSTLKIVSIRRVQGLQAQYYCPIETPEGQKIGLQKSLSMMCTVTTQNYSQDKVIELFIQDYKCLDLGNLNPLDMRKYIKIFMCGDWRWVCDLHTGLKLYKDLKEARRTGKIDIYTTITLDYERKELKILYDGGRLIRCCLLVENNKLNFTNELVDEVNSELKKDDKHKGWKRIINKYTNIVEYEDVESSHYMMCAINYKKLLENEKNMTYDGTDKNNRYGKNRWVDYTHCDFHSWTMLGMTAGNTPFSNHNNGWRNIIHFAQAKQAISIPLSTYKDRMDTHNQILYNLQVPIVQTEHMKYNNTINLPYGENIILAIASYNGYNQEDSMIINKNAIDRGLFRADIIKRYTSKINKNPTTNQEDIFAKPDKNKVAVTRVGNYSKLNEKGYVDEEIEVNDGDFIIGKITPIQPTGDSAKVFKDNSVQYKSNVKGVIDRVHTDIYDNEGYKMIDIKVRAERIPVIGDKFSNFHGNKGTVGILLPQRDMPFTKTGMIPDVIINPHCLPSRMCIGQLVEMMASKIGAVSGTFVDGTPYNDYDTSKLPEMLEKLGFNKYGNETMYCGITGRKMQTEIFMAPCYLIRLKHMTDDKYHARSCGPRESLTRQPLEGRSKAGGLKIGEMEKDSMICHGMAQFTKERFMETSDITKFYVCEICGMIASKSLNGDHHECIACNTTNVSAIVMPYAAKLLFQELLSIGIMPRIRIENNIYANECV